MLCREDREQHLVIQLEEDLVVEADHLLATLALQV
tara:strand:+ start:223 stop:327 length:105 start_codon:yes stop_codon:yes gene_type:complete